MGGLSPGPGWMSGYLWTIVRAPVAVALVWGNVTVAVPVQWQENLERRVLDDANTIVVIRPGYESSPGSTQLIHRWGLLMGSIPGTTHW